MSRSPLSLWTAAVDGAQTIEALAYLEDRIGAVVLSTGISQHGPAARMMRKMLDRRLEALASQEIADSNNARTK